ncbi:MAG: TonB-dependent receptor [Rhizomicrobium sp.]
MQSRVLVSGGLKAGALTVLAAAAIPVAAQAQSDSSGIETITVTADRRTEDVQKVPMSVTAISADVIKASGLTVSSDLPALSPDLVMDNTRNSITPYIRGVGTQSGTAGDEGSVGIYVDGVLYASASSNLFSFNNIQRVEVLKGPQGTLFGRNTTGGVIQIITRDPSQTQSADISLGYGNFDTVTASLYATTGVTDDIATDLSVFVRNQGQGWGKNLFLGNDVNFDNEFAIRSKTKYDVDADTSVVLSLDYSKQYSDFGNTRTQFGTSRSLNGQSRLGTIYDTDGNMPVTDDHNETMGAALVVKHDFSWATLTSTTAYRTYQPITDYDLDNTPVSYTSAITFEKTRTLQQELLLTGGTDWLDWVAGAFYWDEPSTYGQTLSSTTTASTNSLQVATMTTSSYAVFGQATAHITSDTSLTGGLRYTTDRRHIVGTTVAEAGNPSPVGTLIRTTATLPASQTSRTFSQITYRVTLDHSFTDSIFGYLTTSRGFKSGVFSLSSPYSAAVNPEVLIDYEGGLKSDLFDRMLQVNLAGFYYRYSNIQLSAVNPNGIGISVLNAASAQVKGGEFDVTALPPVEVGQLLVRAQASYVDGVYTSFPKGVGYAPNPAGGNTQLTAADFSGNRMIRTPQWSTSLSLDYSVPAGKLGTVDLNLLWSYAGDYYWDPENRTKQPAVNLVNAQIGISPTDKWEVRLFGRNLLDEKYYTNVSSSTQGDGASPAAPRTFGVELDLHY